MINIQHSSNILNTYNINDTPTDVNSIAFSTDGSAVLTSTGNDFGDDNTAWIWSVDECRLMHDIKGENQKLNKMLTYKFGYSTSIFGSPLVHASFSNNGMYVACASSNTFSVWSSEREKKASSTIQFWTEVSNTLIFEEKIDSPNLELRWESTRYGDAQVQSELWLVHPTIFTTSWSPDDTTIATSSSDGIVRLWNAHNGKLNKILAGHTGSVRSANFSPSGAKIVSTGLDVRLWDVQSGECTGILLGHTKPVHTGIWRPDGKQILTLGQDATMRLWNTDTGEQVHTVNYYANDAAFSPDGDYFVTVFDKTLSIWNVQYLRQDLIVELKSPIPYLSWLLSCVAWSLDGSHIAAGGTNSLAGIWKIHFV